MTIRIFVAAIAAAAYFSSPTLVSSVQAQQQPQQSEEMQRPVPDDPIGQLQLTPEQREQIRLIRTQTAPERRVINQRFREASNALEMSLEADNPDEALIEENLRRHAVAQAAQVRMRIMTELKIRRVLTPEQRVVLKQLQHAQREMRERRQRRIQDALTNPRRPNRRNTLTTP